MIKKMAYSLALTAAFAMAQNKLWTATGAQVGFYSSTPVEDIKALTQTAVSTLDPHSGKIDIKLRNQSFNFPNKLMQEHFNENYMESDKYPFSEFHGQILGADSAKMATGQWANIQVRGEMWIHGVKKTYAVPARMKLESDGSYSGDIKFKIKVADHGIQIPTIVMAKIAEEVEVSGHFYWKKPQ